MKKIMTYAAGMVSLGLMLAFGNAFGQGKNLGSAQTKVGYGSTVSPQVPETPKPHRPRPIPRKALWK